MAHSAATLNNVLILTNDTDPLLSGTYDILGDTVDSFTLQIIDSSLAVVATVSSSVLSAAQGWSFNGGNWSVDLSAIASPVTLAEGAYSINITTVDTTLDSVVYNPVGVELTIDTSATITLDTPIGIAADGYINAAEQNTPLVLSGTATGVEDGQTVTVIITDTNSTTTTATTVVDGGVWQLADPNNYSEALVNTTTAGDQGSPAITALSDGGYVVTWTSENQDGDGSGIYAQRYDAGSNPVGSEILINTTTVNNQQHSAITALSDGGYVVAWESSDQDGSFWNIYAQRYDASSNAVGGETLVNTTTANYQQGAAITALSDGGYVVTWTSKGQDGSGWGIYAQRYDASSNPVGSETLINTYKGNDQTSPAITALSDGSYMVAWESWYRDGFFTESLGIKGQRYDSDNNPVGSETLLVDRSVATGEYSPAITALSDGGYMVTWKGTGDEFGTDSHIYGQRYDADSNRVGSESFLISSYYFGVKYDFHPAVTALNDGGFVVTWSSGYGSTSDVYAQRYDANSNPIGDETLVNITTTSYQQNSTITALNDGGWVVAWQSDNQDGDGYGVYTQRYDVNGSATGGIDLSGLVDGPLTIDVMVTDGAGNSATAQDTSVMIDVTAPVAPVIVNVVGDSAGIEGNGYLTRSEITEIVLLGTAEANSTVVLSVAGLGEVATVQASALGQWSLNLADTAGLPSILAVESSVNLTVTATDAAGNTSAASDTFIIHIASITIDTPAGDAIDAYINSAEVNNPLYLSGSVTSVEDGQAVTVMITDANDTTITATTTVNGGLWQLAEPWRYTETLVNSTTENKQQNSAVTALSDGGYVVTWESALQDGSGFGIYAQRYDAGSNPINSETLVNTTTVNNQQHPTIAALSDGGYVIVWTSQNQDGDGLGVYAQRYDASSNSVSGETLINTNIANNQQNSAATGLSDGGFVVSWESELQDGSGFGIFAQRYDASGNSVGGETLVNLSTVNDQKNSAITALSDGGYVVTWQSFDGGAEDIYAQRYDDNGNSVGGETVINSITYGGQTNPAITALSNGGYVVTWTSNHQDGDGLGVYAQRYDASSNSVGGEVLINTTTANNQQYSTVTGLSGGGFVVIWEGWHQDGDGAGIYAQRYDASSNPVGGETLVNTTTASHQAAPAITALNDGGYVVTWTSQNQDGDGAGIYTQRFAADGSTSGAVAYGVDLSGLVDGTLTIDVSVLDVVGNEATAQNTSIVIDTVAPAVPTITDVVGDSQPTVTGTIDSDVTDLTVSVDGRTYHLGSDAALTVTGLGQWSLDLSQTTHYLNSGSSYDVSVYAEDAAGNGTYDTSVNEVTVLDAANVLMPTVSAINTSNTHQWLSGWFDSANTESLIVTVDGKTYSLGIDSNLFQHAHNNNIWVLKPQGFYHLGEHNVVVSAVGSNGFAVVDQTVGELTISRDMFAPQVNPPKQIYNKRPAIGGIYDEAATKTLTVEFDGKVYTLGEDAELENHNTNRWRLDLSTLSTPLSDGVYDVVATTTDANNVTLQDASTGELTIGMLAPTVNALESTNFKPVLSGFYDSDFASALTVTVNGRSYTLGVDSELTTHVNDDNVWILQSGQRLVFGDTDIHVTATDTRGKDKTDVTTDEIHIYQTKSQAVHGDVLITQAGNDTITINDNTFTQIDAGAGRDTLILEGDGINLNFANIQGIDVVDMGEGVITANTLTLTLSDVLSSTDNSSLLVLGDSADTVALAIGDNWAAQGNRVIDGITFEGYDSGSASLLIEQSINVQIV